MRTGRQGKGVRIAHVGKRALAETGGFCVKPTILDGASNCMRIAQEEIFGPVVVVIPFETEGEVVSLANDSIYGLAAAEGTRDMGAARRSVARDARRHGLGQHLRPFVARDPVRRPQAVRFRARPLAARDRQVHGLQDHLDPLSIRVGAETKRRRRPKRRLALGKDIRRARTLPSAGPRPEGHHHRRRDHPSSPAFRSAVPRELGHQAAHLLGRGDRRRSHRPRRDRLRLGRHDARIRGP